MVFYIYPHISISNTPQYFLWILVITWYHFLWAQSSSFIISDREDLPAVDSLSFCLSGNVLFQLHFWRIVLLDINFLVQFFFLSVLWVSFYCFLASTIAYEPLPYYYYFFLHDDLFCSFQDFPFQQFDYDISGCGSLCVFLLGILGTVG